MPGAFTATKRLNKKYMDVFFIIIYIGSRTSEFYEDNISRLNKEEIEILARVPSLVRAGERFSARTPVFPSE